MSDTEAFDTLFDDKARAAHAAGPVGYDEEGVRQAVRLFLKSIGEDPDREGLLDTPRPYWACLQGAVRRTWTRPRGSA